MNGTKAAATQDLWRRCWFLHVTEATDKSVNVESVSTMLHARCPTRLDNLGLDHLRLINVDHYSLSYVSDLGMGKCEEHIKRVPSFDHTKPWKQCKILWCIMLVEMIKRFMYSSHKLEQSTNRLTGLWYWCVKSESLNSPAAPDQFANPPSANGLCRAEVRLWQRWFLWSPAVDNNLYRCHWKLARW